MAATFIRADADDNRAIEITDAIAILDFLFLNGTAVACQDAADANDDGQLDVADPIVVLMHLFLGLPSLPPPFPDLGEDPTADNLDC